MCTDASNINGRMVAGEASLSQFLFGGGAHRREFLYSYKYQVSRAGDKNSPKAPSCAKTKNSTSRAAKREEKEKCHFSIIMGTTKAAIILSVILSATHLNLHL